MLDKKKVAMILAEFLGAALLSVALYSVVIRTSFPIFTATVVGVAAGFLALIFQNVSGGHANPAVTVGMWTIRKIDSMQAIVYIAAQMLGGLGAWSLLKYFTGRELTNLAGKNFEWKILIAEAIGAAVFTFGVAAATMLKFDGVKFASVVGVSLFLGVMVAAMASNAIVNPAIALGIQSWDWAYATGPIIGGIVGMNLYGLLFAETKASKK